MPSEERFRRLLAAGGSEDTTYRDLAAAALCDLESQIAGAMCLYVVGDSEGVREMLGHPHTVPAAAAAAPLLSSFAAAAAAINAAVGDDPTRGYAALTTLQERAAEYAATRDELIARHADQGPA